jgi:hypothetical protein
MTDTLIQAIQSGSPTLIVGAVLLVLVALARLPGLAPQWKRIPTTYRPIVPAVAALLASIGEVLVAGRGWVPALVTGLVAGLPGVLLALPSPVADRPTTPPEN